LAIAARYIFNPRIFETIKRTPPDNAGEMQITDSIRILVRDKLPVHCLKLNSKEKRYDIGNFETYFRAFVDFAMKDDKYGYTLRQYLHRHFVE
jgi:UTP--glucose-1-phosphate uridylyltransferase